MRSRAFFLSTLKEAPAEAELVSHKLMVRAGLIKKLGSGLYSWMPLGLRVLRRVEGQLIEIPYQTRHQDEEPRGIRSRCRVARRRFRSRTRALYDWIATAQESQVQSRHSGLPRTRAVLGETHLGRCAARRDAQLRFCTADSLSCVGTCAEAHLGVCWSAP